MGFGLRGKQRSRDLMLEKRKGRPLRDALYKLERAKLSLVLEVLVMKAHCLSPSVVETLRLRSRDLKLVNCLATL
jgi:hypothetical protein